MPAAQLIGAGAPTFDLRRSRLPRSGKEPVARPAWRRVGEPRRAWERAGLGRRRVEGRAWQGPPLQGRRVALGKRGSGVGETGRVWTVGWQERIVD